MERNTKFAAWILAQVESGALWVDPQDPGSTAALGRLALRAARLDKALGFCRLGARQLRRRGRQREAVRLTESTLADPGLRAAVTADRRLKKAVHCLALRGAHLCGLVGRYAKGLELLETTGVTEGRGWRAWRTLRGRWR